MPASLTLQIGNQFFFAAQNANTGSCAVFTTQATTI